MTRDPLFDRLAAMWRERDPMPPDLPGRVLARLSDLGWGTPLRELFTTDEAGVPVDAEVPPALAKGAANIEWALSVA